MNKKRKTVAIIVAHPDDETLWAGGTILSNPGWNCFIASLCRGDDPDRAPKFKRALKILGALGIMGDLDDGPEQIPLNEEVVQNKILDLLPLTPFDLIITHSPYGEYTSHRRYEEIGRAVINLWHSDKLSSAEVWAFAFEDHHQQYNPVAIETASIFYSLPFEVWEKKYSIVTDIYGFTQESWEAQTTPKEEAFWQFSVAKDAYNWLVNAKQHKSKF